MPWRQSILPQLRTAARPGQQRPISQLTVATDRTIVTYPGVSTPIEGHSRFSQQRGIHSFHPLNATPTASAMRLPSARYFSSDNKDGKPDDDKKEKSEEKTEEKEENKEKLEDTKGKETATAGDGMDETTKDNTTAAAADPEPDTPASKPEDDECPPWMNPLHHADKNPPAEFADELKPGEELKILPAPPFEDPNNPDKVLASQEVYDLADEIVTLSMLEMKELVTKIADHFGFEKPPFRGSDGSGGGGGGGGDDDGEEEVAAAAEKTHFDVKLESFDAKSKIKVIKEVRAVAGLGLKEAKELVEGAPKVVMKEVSKEAAEELKEKLEAVGAVIEIV